MTLSYVSRYYRRRQKQKERIKHEQTQARASELTNAKTIGSVIHVAGHPLFDRNQPVVLALNGDELSIHTYQSSIPKDVINISNIRALHPVVYDNDRIPYIDVIDNTAQALQMMIASQGKEYSCLFRRFRKV